MHPRNIIPQLNGTPMGRRRKPEKCPCDLDTFYKVCCGRLHAGSASAETPVELMRSRYSAYKRGLVDYIIATTDPDGDRWESNLAEWRESIAVFARDFEFVSLEIVSEPTTETLAGEVTFRACITRHDGVDASFSEKSTFRKKDGVWLYTSGETREF